jgi:hypothetical protein
LQAGTQALSLPIHLPHHRVIGVLVCVRALTCLLLLLPLMMMATMRGSTQSTSTRRDQTTNNFTTCARDTRATSSVPSSCPTPTTTRTHPLVFATCGHTRHSHFLLVSMHEAWCRVAWTARFDAPSLVGRARARSSILRPCTWSSRCPSSPVPVPSSSPHTKTVRHSPSSSSCSAPLATHIVNLILLAPGTVRLFDLRLRENNPENIAVDLRSERGERYELTDLSH